MDHNAWRFFFLFLLEMLAISKGDVYANEVVGVFSRVLVSSSANKIVEKNSSICGRFSFCWNI